MSAYLWAYHKIRVWLLWRMLGIKSPSVVLYGIPHTVTPRQCAEYDEILRRAMLGVYE